MGSLGVGIVNDTGGRGHCGCDLVMAEVDRHLARQGMHRVWSHRVGKDWREQAEQIRQWPRADVVVVNGEGSIHDSATRARAVYLPAFGKFCREQLGVPAFLINSTITAIGDELTEHLHCFAGIYVRERASQAELAGLGVRAEVVGDLTVGAKLPRSGRRRGVMASDSTLEEVRTTLSAVAGRRGWAYEPIRAERRWQDRWLSWARSPGWLRYARRLCEHELVVTGRFHTVAMCLATRTPFVAVSSNTQKIEWLLDDVFGSRHRLVRAEALGELEVARYAHWSEQERADVERATEGVSKGANGMFEAIHAAAGGRM